MKRITLLIDPGHGGMIDDIYQTFPEKMFQHSKTEVFYEGVFNRIIKKKLIYKLDALGFHNIDICPTELDLELDERVDIANIYHREYGNCLLISLHSNAGRGTGFEIWTSVGETKSDRYAHMLGEELMRTFPDVTFRKDSATGEIDKEAHFYILKWSKCPAILPECLFFDNYKDYQMLINEAFQDKYVDALVNFIKKAELVTV